MHTQVTIARVSILGSAFSSQKCARELLVHQTQLDRYLSRYDLTPLERKTAETQSALLREQTNSLLQTAKQLREMGMSRKPSRPVLRLV